MEPIATSVIAGLVTKALGGSAGSIPRLIRTGRQKRVQQALAGLNSSAQSFLLPALAGLGERGDGAQEAVGAFLGSVEAESYVRSVACAVLSQQKDLYPELHDQLTALLILVAGAYRESMVHDLATFLLSMFTRTIETAARQLERADRKLHLSIRERAQSELRSGSLDGLVQRSRLLRHRDPAELADFLTFAKQYRGLLHDRTSELVPAYFDVQRRVPIEKLYVTPRFAYEQTEETLDELLAHSYRTVILGDPGAGKSTFVQYLAHLYSNPQHFDGTVPFVVTLRAYEEWKNTAHGSVVDFLNATILENYQLKAPDGAIEYLLLTGRAFVLFDGLDELLNIAKRQAICEVIANFADLYATATVIVTSRKIGYFEAPINPLRFTTAALLNFTDDDVATYVANWFAVDDRLDKRTQETMVRSFLEESEPVRDIRSNALMLGLMCNLYRGVRTIPQNRVDLYEKCAAMLFERWDASRGIATSNVLKADAKAALQDIALWMYTDVTRSDGVTEKQLIHRLTEFWTRRFEDHSRAADVARELIALWKGRTWVLTDVGSSAANHGLIYKFTHRTFLEFFAAVEVVRRNPSPEALWETLARPVAQGNWEIVAQLAIQKLDEFYLDGADQVLELLIKNATDTTEVHSCYYLLSFATRNLENLFATPATERHLVTAALDLALVTMPTSGPIASFHEHRTLLEREMWPPQREEQPEPQIRVIGRREVWHPLLKLLATTGDRRELVTDQLLRRCCALLDSAVPTLAAEAFVFLLLPSRLAELALLPGEALDDELHIGIPRELWNITAIEHQLGRGLGPSQIREWARHNFWVAVLAAREGLISIEEMVRSAGVASVACAADPLFGMGTVLAEGSPLEELLLRYLDCTTSEDICRGSAAEARRTLAFIGQELTRELVTFDGFWLPETVLYDRVVTRRFLSDRDTPLPAATKAPATDELDAMFGAAVLLAVVVEEERWDLLDYSEDQLGSLALGPLQVLEPVYVARRTEGFWGLEVDRALDKSGLSQQRKQILADWASKRTNFTVG